MSWDPVFDLLDIGITDRVFSGAALGVWSNEKGACSYFSGRTSFVPELSQKVNEQTIFDLASLTKVFATTLIAARLRARSEIELDSRVMDLDALLKWDSSWDAITVLHLLTHQSGVDAWRDFKSLLKVSSPRDCGPARKVEAIRQIAESPLPEEPGEVTKYSDLGFILLGNLLERQSGLSLEDLFETEVRKPLGTTSFCWNPRRNSVEERFIVATEESQWRGGLIHGDVHDDNAFVMGGVAGHAGLFSNLADSLKIGKFWLDAYLGKSTHLPKDIAQEFFEIHHSMDGQCRALGWDVPTSLNSAAGKNVSEKAVGHLGYTGTSVWIDLVREAVVVLLTNRVHPSSENERIKLFRPIIHDRIWSELDS